MTEREVRVRRATAEDVDTILELVHALAVYEREPDALKATREDYLRDGFGPVPRFEALLAEVAEEGGWRAVGLALFFPNYSTWEGRPGLYLEDLFVREEARGRGIGRRLLASLAALAVDRGWARLDLSVLDWNPARAFYERLDMTHQEVWRPYRLTGEALARLAQETAPPA